MSRLETAAPAPQHIFRGVADWEKIAALGEKTEIEPFEMLRHPFEGEERCYVVLSGSLLEKIFRRGKEASALNIYQRGAILFESHAMVNTKSKAVYFEALERTSVSCILRTALRDAVVSDPTVGSVLVDSLFCKLAACIDQLDDSHTRTASERVLSLLVELCLAADTPQDDPEWLHADLRLSQQTMADMLCMNRVTVAKALNHLRDVGSVATHGKQMLVARDAVLPSGE